MSDLIVIGNNKGGVGKTTAIISAIEQAIRLGKSVYVVEGDPSIPDVQLRYEGLLPGAQISLHRPESAGDVHVELFSAIQAMLDRFDVFTVNSPAGSNSTHDSVAQDLLEPIIKSLGLRLIVPFIIGPGEDSVQCFRESLREGICSIADVCIAVPNAFFGDPERFEWHTSDLRRQFLEAGHPEFALPKMIARVSDRVRHTQGSLHEMAEGRLGDLSLAERAGLSSWLRATAPLGDLIFGSESTEGDAE